MATRWNTRRVTRSKPTARWLPPVLIALMLLLVWYVGESGSMLPRSFPGAGDGFQMATVNTNVLNVRGGPSTDEPVVATATAGDRLEVTGPATAGFLPVRSGALTGWTAVDYLTVDEPEHSERGAAQALAAGGAQDPSEPPSAPTIAPQANRPPVSRPEEVPADETAAPVTAERERWIRIDRSDATVTLYVGGQVAGVFAGRFGRDPSPDGFYATAVGSYRVYDMHKGLSPTPFAEDTYLTDWVGFDPVRKNGLHSPVRERDGTVRDWQNPTTLGCVRLNAADAETVFAFATIGMRVEVVE